MKPYLVVKKTLDWITACFLIILSSPIMLAATIAIKIGSKGPVLFRQKRPGKMGKIFTVYKFRTMSLETDQDGNLLPDILRMTRVGSFLRKCSIDELPQLFNILKGDMSFIGPRPLLVQYLKHYTPEQNRRHEVVPGISGWAQVNGRNTISWEEKFQYDVWYVDHISLSLDTKIVFKTIKNVLVREGINNSQNDTMPMFSGSTLDI
ncbi:MULTISPECIES: sugar transferase [Paenibacillus]|uniref:sugar transferase n=1 Tax=Paenibacillus TaxID=44249 RepID=UPI00096F1C22|nr:sugar transferase [Paenibacillus odorifer]OMD13996.1 lipid carrier--UDP-N-acetylgalactosaminyltransferase [Paenibacillus odorifer]OME03155.1 lipid carrier--UDP-N-acetylgalactosaminyltransferase [Paenibacillus odorifer]